MTLRRDTRTVVGRIAPLRRGDRWVVQGGDEPVEPAGVQHDVLIDLADDRKTSGANAGVDRRGRPAFVAGDDSEIGRVDVPNDVDRPVLATVVHDDRFDRAAVALTRDAGKDVADPALSVPYGNDEADRRPVHPAPSIARYSSTSRSQIRPLP